PIASRYVPTLPPPPPPPPFPYTTLFRSHHFGLYGGLTPNPQLLLTAISQRTRRLRLGSSVSVLPLHHPLRVAEDFAMLDVLSGGDRKSTRLNSSHQIISYAVFCLKKKIT